jgi:hypothetical protein
LINENAPAHDESGWFVSSFTNGGGSCVQVKFHEQGTILVRDSKDSHTTSPIIRISSHAWTSLLSNISH